MTKAITFRIESPKWSPTKRPTNVIDFIHYFA
jgi:hypothetical protein